MKQYLELLQEIKDKGVHKPAAREGMPSTQSLFGYQFRHNLKDGFPLLTTKKINFKHIVVELLWFLRGDTNIKFLVDNGVNIWNEDAYNYYVKLCKKAGIETEFDVNDSDSSDGMYAFSFEEFIEEVKNPTGALSFLDKVKSNYKWGDCGYQYGKVWRSWENLEVKGREERVRGRWEIVRKHNKVDQIKNLIDGLRNNPQSRRHILTAVDPAHDQDLALYWCHSMVQFNARPLANKEKLDYMGVEYSDTADLDIVFKNEERIWREELRKFEVPKYALDCQMYQRSADVFLGVPYNIASYALLTHIIAKMVNMIPGEFIHTFGDVHIYENHKEQVDEILSREPKELPTLRLHDGNVWDDSIDNLLSFIGAEIDEGTTINDLFPLEGYSPHPPIKAKLSTGLT